LALVEQEEQAAQVPLVMLVLMAATLFLVLLHQQAAVEVVVTPHQWDQEAVWLEVLVVERQTGIPHHLGLETHQALALHRETMEEIPQIAATTLTALAVAVALVRLAVMQR
jgi:predicted transglutaminase-like cysteine proteinase